MIRWPVKGQWPVRQVCRQLLQAPSGNAVLCDNFIMLAGGVGEGAGRQGEEGHVSNTSANYSRDIKANPHPPWSDTCPPRP